MDIPENTSPQEPVSSSDQHGEIEALWQFVVSVLVLVIVVSGTLNIYLARQWKNAGDDLKSVRPQTQNLVAAFQKGEGPAIAAILQKLQEFGQTHPDFVPILNKYGQRPASGAAPAAAPATAPVPAKK